MTFLFFINMIAAFLVMFRAFCALNDMNADAGHHLDRIFCSITATGAVAVLLGPLYGYTSPRTAEVALNAGFAGLYALPWIFLIAKHRIWSKSND